MNDIRDVASGRIEDKWIEFVATEFAARTRRHVHVGRVCQARAAECVRHVEVHASYLWLLAGAIVALLIR
jgi:hypothetical protein